jgi:predicted aminopeptidase
MKLSLEFGRELGMKLGTKLSMKAVALLQPKRWRWLRWSLAALLGAAGVCLGVVGCADVGYLAQSASGHVRLMAAAKPVPDWLADPAAPQALKDKLALTQRMRDFAVTELHLPDNSSYRRYADLGRSAAVWNVAAAPELSLQLHTWCFPVTGCVGYRGYYQEADAQALASQLRAQGLEAVVYPVPAYSTLGKLEWLGGDPLLNTFIQRSELELARLIFHELAHQVVFAPGDTAFNESFATAVERLGGQRWLTAEHGEQQALAQQQASAQAEQRRSEFRALTAKYRSALQTLYQSAQPEAQKRLEKAQLMQAMREEYAQLKRSRWAGFAGYDAFFAQANNASLAMQAAYLQHVPAFELLFAQAGQAFAPFYAQVRRLAVLPQNERNAALRELVKTPLTPSTPQRPLD